MQCQRADLQLFTAVNNVSRSSLLVLEAKSSAGYYRVPRPFDGGGRETVTPGRFTAVNQPSCIAPARPGHAVLGEATPSVALKT